MRLFNLTLFIALSALTGCDRPVITVKSPITAPVTDEGIHVFHDRRHAVYEWVFIVRGDTVLAQRHEFPGYADPMMLLVKTLDATTASSLGPFKILNGDAKPPLPPHGTYFARTDVGAPGGQSVTVNFADDNKPVATMLTELQAAVTRDGTRITEPPDWVTGNPELMRALGH